jgi:hypothetical protein
METVATIDLFIVLQSISRMKRALKLAKRA